MPKHQGINRNYSATDEYGGKTPEERAKELKKKMDEFLAKGGKVEKLAPGAAYNLGSMEKSGKPHWTDRELKDQAKKKTAKIPLKLLNELLITMQKGCLCALCGAIPTPIMNILKYFGDEMKSDMVKDN